MMGTPVLVTAPTIEPVSLEDFKLHARIESDANEEDYMLEQIIKGARREVEAVTRRALITQTWAYYLEEWPSGDRIKLPFGNLQTTNLVMTYDEVDTDNTKNTETMTLSTDYLIETNDDQCGYIVLPYGETWPSFTHWPTHSIKIQFQCGWTTRDSVPYEIKAAMMLTALDTYSNRERTLLTQSFLTYHTNPAFTNLLASYRLWDEW
jgi:uncharacterized phiE125 gp8 family phage protein